MNANNVRICDAKATHNYASMGRTNNVVLKLSCWAVLQKSSLCYSTTMVFEDVMFQKLINNNDKYVQELGPLKVCRNQH